MLKYYVAFEILMSGYKTRLSTAR